MEHLIFSQNWKVHVIINENGRSLISFSQKTFNPELPKESEKKVESSFSFMEYIKNLAGTTSHIVSKVSQRIGSTGVITINPTHCTLRWSNTTLLQVLAHPHCFDIHIKHNRLVVMETIPSSAPQSLSTLVRHRKIPIVKHESTAKRRASLSRRIKKIARRRLSNLRRN